MNVSKLFVIHINNEVTIYQKHMRIIIKLFEKFNNGNNKMFVAWYIYKCAHFQTTPSKDCSILKQSV